MESHILGALSTLDKLLLNPQLRTCSVAVPGTTRNGDSGNREPNGDRFSNDPCPEARISSRHSGNLISSEVEQYHHMVTGGPEEFCSRSHLKTGSQEEILYCSPETCSGKPKKARSTNQPQFRSQSTPSTI